MARKAKKKAEVSASIGYEAQLWQMADALRGSMDAAEYKHVFRGERYFRTNSAWSENVRCHGSGAEAA